MPRILIVTKDTHFKAACGALVDRKIKVKFASDFKTALHELLKSTFDALIVDLAKEKESTDFIKRVRRTPELSAVPILVAAEWGAGYSTLALSLGANAYEPQPCDAANLLASVKRLLKGERAVAK
jgi:DNA-binding response OmpR family regulator